MAEPRNEERRTAHGLNHRERTIGTALLVLGLAIAGGALMKVPHEQFHMAQASSDTPSGPADAKPGGTRPTTPAPEPAQPQAAPGQTTGSAPLTSQDRPPEVGKPLPPAPAEKVAPPIDSKK